jgi:CRP-like cAMP-binding protein
MKREAQHSYCTDAEWVGRADCKHCSIRSMMLFSGLPDRAFGKTLGPIDNFAYAPGTALYDAQQQGAAIFSIRRGLVKLLHLGPDGSQRILRLLGAGSVAGLELLDGHETYSHSAVAVNRLDVCRIPVSTIAALEKEFPDLSRQSRHRVQEQLDRADEWILTMGTGPARHRIAHLLLFLSRCSADANGDIELLAGEDMAAIVGTSIETVSRIIADLKRRGLLHRVATHLYRCDTVALQSMTRESAD